MKVTTENIGKIEYYAGTKYAGMKSQITLSSSLLTGLLYDLESINRLCAKNGSLYIDYEDEHTAYDPERTDPCPDYYGYFTLRWENEPHKTVGVEMTLEELDGVLCALCDFVEKTVP